MSIDIYNFLFNTTKKKTKRKSSYVFNMDDVKEYLKKYPDPNKEYKNFRIPKKSGGFREINEPNPELKEIQKSLKTKFELIELSISNIAFAYRKNKSCYDAAKQHKNNSYVLKLDFHDFFGSIDSDILNKYLNMAFREKEIAISKDDINKIVKVLTLDNKLPQGSPTSPTVSNIVMYQFDKAMRKALNNALKDESLIITRYADDIMISSKNHINQDKVIYIINKLLDYYFNGKIKLNDKKTKQLKNTKRLYILGVKLNKDNNLTFGHEKKKKLKLDLYNLFINFKNNNVSIEEIQHTLGMFSYMKSIEPDYANFLERKLLKQFDSNAANIYKHFL